MGEIIDITNNIVYYFDKTGNLTTPKNCKHIIDNINYKDQKQTI